MIDFHCHLDLYKTPTKVIESSVTKKCYILAVTTTPLAWSGTKKLIGDAPLIRMALGLHPELVSTRHHELVQFLELINETRFLGEIGIDGSGDNKTSLALQKDTFSAILKAAQDAGGKIMSIHSRGAVSEVLDELEKLPNAGVAVLHWFSGSIGQLQRSIELGCWFSVGPAMLNTAMGRKLSEKMPMNRVLTETDGPFTGRNNLPFMPWEVALAESELAKLWSRSEKETCQQIASNLQRLVSKPVDERYLPL